jgi:hypothetical protein
MPHPTHGRWTDRAITVLAEAGQPLRLRQIVIRCGMTSVGDPQTTRRMAGILAPLVRAGVVVKARWGMYALPALGRSTVFMTD